jgi:hypothetical protein
MSSGFLVAHRLSVVDIVILNPILLRAGNSDMAALLRMSWCVVVLVYGELPLRGVMPATVAGWLVLQLRVDGVGGRGVRECHECPLERPVTGN